MIAMPPLALWHETMLSHVRRLDPPPDRVFTADRSGLWEVIWEEDAAPEEPIFGADHTGGEEGDGDEDLWYWTGPRHTLRHITALPSSPPPFEATGMRAAAQAEIADGHTDAHLYLVLGASLNRGRAELIPAWRETCVHVQSNGTAIGKSLPHSSLIAAVIPTQVLVQPDVYRALQNGVMSYTRTGVNTHAEYMLLTSSTREVMGYTPPGEMPPLGAAVTTMFLLSGLAFTLALVT